MLRLLSHAGFFVKTATLQLTEQPFSRELFLGNLQSFFDIVVEDLDFHPVDFRLSQAKWTCCSRFSINRGRSLTQALEFLKTLRGLCDSELYGLYKLLISLCIFICANRNKACLSCCKGYGQTHREI